MIEINLMPDNLKKNTQKIEFNKELYANFIIGAVAVFVFIHLLISGTFIFKKIKLKSLNNTWPKISQDLKQINSIKDEIKVLQLDVNSLSELTKNRLDIAVVLNKLSANLPNGIWFRYLKLDENEFEVDGSVVSLSGDEVAVLNRYLTSLKNEKDIKVFSKLELVDAKKRTFQGIDLIDFVLKAKIK